MSTSVYAPPSSPIPDQQAAPAALRWHGAAVFAAIPLIAAAVLQANHLYEKAFLLSVRNFEPLLVLLPIAFLMGASGFAAAVPCCRGSRGRALLACAMVCAAWSLVILAAGNLFELTKTGAFLPPFKQVMVFLTLCLFVAPVALLLCAILRWYGRRGRFALGRATVQP